MDSTRRDFLVQAAGSLAALALVPNLSGAHAPLAEPLNVGLIGCGRHGRAIISELQKIENLKIAAVCDSDQRRAEAGAKRAGGAEVFTDHKALLDKAKGVTALIIATPTHLHKDVALDALSAGRHVYCEAPMAHTIDDCRALVKAAAAAKTVFQVGHEGRANPVYHLARGFFRSDSVRDVVTIETFQYEKTSWRFPASDAARERELNWRLDPEVSLGLAGEWMSHQFDVAHWYTDDLPTKISGFGAIRLWNDGRKVADTAHVDLHFGAYRLGASASLATSYLQRHEVFRGTNATIKLAWSHGWMFKEADAPTQGWEVYANRQQFHRDEGITLIAGATKLAEQGKLKDGVGLPYPSLYYPLWEFAQAVTQGKKPVCDAEAGYKAAVMGILAARAVATGSEVTIDPAVWKVTA